MKRLSNKTELKETLNDMATALFNIKVDFIDVKNKLKDNEEFSSLLKDFEKEYEVFENKLHDIKDKL